MFIDNNAALFSAISGTSSCADSAELLLSLAYINAKVQSDDWYSRVPSPSNPADEPSRRPEASYNTCPIRGRRVGFPSYMEVILQCAQLLPIRKDLAG